jgi:hypothetical protein
MRTPGAGHGLHVLRGERRHARQPLHEVERHALGAEDAARVPAQEEHRRALGHRGAVGHVDAHREARVELPERLDGEQHAGDHAGCRATSARARAGSTAPWRAWSRR